MSVRPTPHRSAIWAIARRELISHFTTPMAWLVLAGWTLATNLAFAWILLQSEPGSISAEPVYILTLRWAGVLVLLLLGPALTMNSFASERVQGTMQLLLTVPVREVDLILGKFLASFALLAILIAATLVQPLVLYFISSVGGPLLIAGYTGMSLLAVFLAALGIWISLLVANPVAAYVITFAVVAGLYLLGLQAQADPHGEGFLIAISAAMGLGPRLESFLIGEVRLADIGWFVAMAGACLVLAHGALSARRIHG